MTTLVLVRHGQASALAEDYDQLSPIGAQQARRVGAHLAAILGGAPSRVLIGPRRRHAQTLAGMLEGAPGSWPEPELVDALDEHHGVQLVKLLTPDYATREHPFGEAIRAVGTSDDPHRAVARVFQAALTGFCRGELCHAEVEDWRAFRARTAGFVRRIADGDDRDTVVAVTSGGTISAMVGEALGSSDEGILELMWSLKNASITRLRFGRPRFFGDDAPSGPRSAQLEVFNETGHLGGDTHLHTHV